MIDSLTKKECTGCNACIDVCPTKAIELLIDSEGFWYPQIIKYKCTECGLCDNVCPVINIKELKQNDFDVPLCFAAIHNNLEVRFDSTSGGLFTALAENIFQNGGNVGGAIYDDDFSVKHYITKNVNDLKKLRSSKYVQSNTLGLFNQVKTLLKQGEKVLVCGTPCQIAGLRKFISKDNQNLILVDFICRGINSPMVFRKYIDWIEKENNSKVTAIKFKNKEYGWRQLTTKITFENGKSLYETKDKSLYMRGYLQGNAFCRPSCYECNFKGFPRLSDITLADFWGIEKFNAELDNDLGTSMVLINSNKGLNFFEAIKEKLTFKELKIDTIFRGNIAINKSIVEPANRNIWFSDLLKYSYGEVANKHLMTKPTLKIRLLLSLKRLWLIKKHTQLKPLTIFRFIQLNYLSKSSFLQKKPGSLFLITPYSVIEIHKTAKININGFFIFGKKKINKSKLESRLLMESNSMIDVKDSFTFGYGANIEIFKGAKLIIKGGKGAYTNINTTIICSERIEIGEGLRCGRNVTIRDNNGGHYISKNGYKDSRPIIIGDKVWLGEDCLIMPGVTIGDGAIIGAKAVVSKDVPPNSIVKGNPAEVTSTGIFWK